MWLETVILIEAGAAFWLAALNVMLLGRAASGARSRARRVAAVALAVAAALVATIPLFRIEGALLLAILTLSGFLFGIIAPSRDMLVRAAAPPGAEGRVFGIVSTGFNIGGAVGPVLFGWLLDSGRPQGIFWSAVLFMLFTVVISLLQERRTARGRGVAQEAAEEAAKQAAVAR